MTAPGQPIVIQREGAGETFARSFAPLQAALAQRKAFQQQEREFQLKREQFELEKQQAGKAGELTDQQIAESKALVRAQEQEFKRNEEVLLATGEAGKIFSEFAVDLAANDITPDMPEFQEMLGDAQSKLDGADQHRAFNQMILERLQGDAQAASIEQSAAETELAQQRQALAESEAQRARLGMALDVARTSTTPLPLGEAAAAAGTQLPEGADPNLILAQLDPQTANAANALWQSSGRPWGEIRSTFGIPEGGIPDNTVFTPAQGAGGAGSQQSQRARQLGTLMVTSNAFITDLEEKAGGITIPASLLRSTNSNVLDILLTRIISPEQRQLVNAYRTFGDAFRFFVSGQQSSDREALRIMNTVSGQAGEDAETLRQKAAMRAIMSQTAVDASNGLLSPTMAAQRLIDEAERLGMDRSKINTFKQIKREAEQYERSIERTGGRIMVNDQPTTADTLNTSTAFVEDVIGNNFTIVPDSSRRAARSGRRN